jgi:hypothetical protein
MIYSTEPERFVIMEYHPELPVSLKIRKAYETRRDEARRDLMSWGF